MQNRAFLTPEIGHVGSRQEIGLDEGGAGAVRLGPPECRYVLWVPAASGRSVVYERDLVLDRTLTVVDPRPALEVSGRAMVDGRGVPARVALVGPGIQITVRAGLDGGFRVPSGTLQDVFLLADYSRDGETYVGKRVVDETGYVEVALERKGTAR
jgi:hypothetical protein